MILGRRRGAEALLSFSCRCGAQKVSALFRKKDGEIYGGKRSGIDSFFRLL